MIYFSKELLVSPYNPNELIGEWTSAGTYTVNLKTSGIYEVTAVSGGGGGIATDGGNDSYSDTYASVFYYGIGATGAYYKANFRLNSGTYTIIVGGGGSGGNNFSASNNGGSTSLNGVISLTGGQGIGTVGGALYSRGNKGYLSFEDTSRLKNTHTYAEGYNYNISTMGPYQSRSNQIGPASSYGLSAYGQGGGCNASTGGYYGTGGYLKIVYKGR